MNYRSSLLLLFLLLLGIPRLGAAQEVSPPARNEARSIRVFVALCDNQTQGIVKVGAKIGNGDDPDANLYWGCSDGFGKVFPRSSRWELVSRKSDVSETILRRIELKHRGEDLHLIADAYRGSEIAACYAAFEAALAGGKYDLVAFIGHNVLMDANIAEPSIVEKPVRSSDAVVLACLSDRYCGPRIDRIGARPVLLTRQLMYPGAFLLHDAIESWRVGGSRDEIRAAAGRAYAKNQKISVRAGTGIFSDLEEKSE